MTATALLLLLASATSGTSGRVPAEVARIVLEKSIADDSPNVVLCIEIDGADPTPAFLRALRRPDRTVVPGSACHVADDADHPTYYSATHAPAVLLSVSETRWTSPTSIEVKASRFYHIKNGRFCTARVTKAGGRWKLVSLDLCEEL